MRPLTMNERIQKILGEPDPRWVIEPKSSFGKPMSPQPSVGNMVEAQAMAGAMAQERAYHEVRFPLTGDFETELINCVNVFVSNFASEPYPAAFSHERIASIFDYLAKRFRDYGKEHDRQQNKQNPDFVGYPGGMDQKIRELQDRLEREAKMFAKAPSRPSTADEVRRLQEAGIDRDKILGDLYR